VQEKSHVDQSVLANFTSKILESMVNNIRQMKTV